MTRTRAAGRVWGWLVAGGRWPVCALLVAAGVLSGCSSTYQLRGKTVEAETSAVMLVEPDDPRLELPGVPGAVVEVRLDPHRLSRQSAGTDISDMDGQFAIPISEFGAGWMEYDAQITARASEHQAVRRTLPLPGAGQRVLILLAPGDDRRRPTSDNVLEETLELAEPYMRGH